jgi:hypothetical protein
LRYRHSRARTAGAPIINAPTDRKRSGKPKAMYRTSLMRDTSA